MKVRADSMETSRGPQNVARHRIDKRAWHRTVTHNNEFYTSVDEYVKTSQASPM